MTGVDQYRPLSMIIDLADDCSEPHLFAFTGPKDWRPRLSRRIFHETVHYWQHISQGFLIRLVEEDWIRLQAFGAGRGAAAAGPLRRRFLNRVRPPGFTVQDIMECHARFWDVQAIGPPNLIELELDDPRRVTEPLLSREEYERLKAEGKIWREIDANGQGRGYSSLSFDLAMELAAGRYAFPYLMLRERVGTVVASALLPLATHAAMQTEVPVEFYAALVDRLAPKIALENGKPIEEHWTRLYPLVLCEALLLAREMFDAEFSVGEIVIEHSRLADHPGYKLALAMLSLAGRHLLDRRQATLLFEGTGMPPEMRARWTLDFRLGCVGMAASREPDLLSFLIPPVVRFAGRRIWVPGSELDAAMRFQKSAPSLGPITALRETFADYLCKVDFDWSSLLAALLKGERSGAG